MTHTDIIEFLSPMHHTHKNVVKLVDGRALARPWKGVEQKNGEGERNGWRLLRMLGHSFHHVKILGHICVTG